ncbi:MAG: LytTR family transcriptional regulator [Balneola sp.]|nr:MAG: LytTR family transcriptional regulator [Balneola sp.]
MTNDSKLTWIAIQFLLAGLILFSLVGTFQELRFLFLMLLLVNFGALILTNLIIYNFSNRVISSIIINVIGVAVFFILGLFFRDTLSFEIIESIASEDGAKVVAARLVSYGGLEFALIYALNAIFTYIPFLEFKRTVSGQEIGNFSNNLFSIRIGKKLHLIPFDEIDFVEAAGNYLQIFSGGKKYTGRLTLNEFHTKTKIEYLVRIHRSYIVNVNQIRELETTSNGYYAILKSGNRIKVGKQYKSDLISSLGIKI